MMDNTVFWDRVEKVNAGMLDTGGEARFVPMSHTADRAANTLWFITAQGTALVEAVQSGQTDAAYIVADSAGGLFARLSGTLTLSTDRAKLEELWNPVAATWFDGGIDDPDIRMLAFHIGTGEVWVTPQSGLRFMFNIAKAKVTGDEPDMGDHFTL